MDSLTTLKYPNSDSMVTTFKMLIRVVVSSACTTRHKLDYSAFECALLWCMIVQ